MLKANPCADLVIRVTVGDIEAGQVKVSVPCSIARSDDQSLLNLIRVNAIRALQDLRLKNPNDIRVKLDEINEATSND